MKEPKIRLKGFRGEWETRTLGSLGSVAMCKRIFKDQTTSKGEVPFFKIGTFGAVPDAFISRELFMEYKSRFNYPKKGDILISAAGTIGRTIEYQGDEAYFQDSNIVWLDHNDEIENSFLKQLYSVITWKGLEGATIKRLYNNIILDTEINLPSIDEQKDVASCFQHLDSLIQSTTKKIESLKQVKAASLQSMFPQEGETTPRVRFKGFDGEWEKVELGKLLNYEQPTPYLVSNADYEANGIPVLTAGKTFILGYTSDNDGIYINLPVIIFDDFTTDTKFVTFPFKAKSSAMKMLNTSRKDIDIRFVYETLKNLHFRVENHQRHWLSVFSKIVVLVPTFEEQQKIASYFTNLDSQITLQTQRLEKLKQIKSACLDNMFV